METWQGTDIQESNFICKLLGKLPKTSTLRGLQSKFSNLMWVKIYLRIGGYKQILTTLFWVLNYVKKCGWGDVQHLHSPKTNMYNICF